jgi:hypothetical protein
MRTGPRLIVAAALVAVAGVAPASPAHAAACEEGGGVTVVVDFASLGGGVETDCAGGDPGSGVEALRAAGHEPTRAAQQAGYFVCRIDGKPANDPCQRASPADAYWSYWHARPGGSWTYSSTGPAERDPAPGTVEGWAFGAGDPPSVAPPRERAAAAPSPAPSRTRAATSPAAAPAAPSPAASPHAPRSTSPTAAATEVVATSAAPAASASSAATAPTMSGAPSATPSPELTPGPVIIDRVDEGGSLAAPLAALGVVLLLAAGAAFQLRSRRSADSA